MTMVYQTAVMSIVYATSGYWRDIQDAVDQAHLLGGAYVQLPDGTFNFVNVGESWTGAKVVIPTGVNVFGGHTEKTSGYSEPNRGMSPNNQVIEYKTVIRLPWDMPGTYSNIPAWFKIQGNGDDTKQSRFSNIKLVGYRSVDQNSVQLNRPLVIMDCVNYRVDHCYFENTPSGIYTFGNYTQKNAGVFDHCYFVNTNGKVVDAIADCTVGYGIQVGRDWGDFWEPNLSKVLGQYTPYSVYVEDCYFEKWRHCISSNDGAHWVIRHSTIKDDFGYGSLDAHGWYQESGGLITQVGTRAVEIYKNVIDNSIQAYWGVRIRGGAGVAFDNICGGGQFRYFMCLSNDMSGIPAAEFVWCNDWYIWGNELIGGCALFTKYDPEGQIIEDINYHFHAPDTFTYVPYQYPHPLATQEQPSSPKTPFLSELEEGVYIISIPESVKIGLDTLSFRHWEDGSTNPKRTINFTVDTSIMATYELTSIINGKVVDAKTEQPIISALVECNGKQSSTDELGNYAFIDLSPLIYTISVSAAGYTGQSVEVDASAGGTFTQDFSLTLSPLPINKKALAAGSLSAVAVVGTIIYIGQKKKR